MVHIVTFSPLNIIKLFPCLWELNSFFFFFLVVDLVVLKLERNIHITKVVIHKINMLQIGVTHISVLC